MKITFLIGSGVSKAAGLPGMDEITEAVMGAGASQSGTEFEPATHVVDPVGEFVRWLSIRAKLRYDVDPHRVINYEDISYLASQIRDDLLGEYDNPAITPLVEKAYSELWPLLPPTQGAVKEQLSSLAYAAVERIHNVLVDMLTKQTEQTSHLKLFCDAAQDCRVSELNLFTLNHDTLLEGFLTKHLDGTIQFSDGFEGAQTAGLRRWAPHLFDQITEQGKRRVCLFKLHGSVDWFRFCPLPQRENNPWLDEFFGVVPGCPRPEIVSHGGRTYTRMDGPLVLIGTFNKIVDYTYPVFFEMHYRFMRALRQTAELIVSGYGFGDKGINRQITNWLCQSPRRKMLLIDPASLEEIKQKARPAISTKLDACLGRDLTHWQEGIGGPNVSWARIAGEFLGLNAGGIA